MNICNPIGGPPAAILAVYSRAVYRLVDGPQVPGSIQWSLQGDVSSIHFEGSDRGQQVTLVTLHASEYAQATTLIATFTPSDASVASTASVALTVFSVSIGNADGASAPVTILGVGNRASYVPVITPDIGLPPGSWTQGNQRGIAVLNCEPSGAVEVLGECVTEAGRDATLCISVAAGDQVARATLPILVFGVEMELMAEALDAPVAAGNEIGVGESRTALARFVPAQAGP
ncbi:MAG: hypothetical protein ACREVL_18510, partial [Solimonas sp.]